MHHQKKQAGLGWAEAWDTGCGIARSSVQTAQREMPIKWLPPDFLHLFLESGSTALGWHSAPLGMGGHRRHHRWMRKGLNREGKSDDHDGFGKEQFD